MGPCGLLRVLIGRSILVAAVVLAWCPVARGQVVFRRADSNADALVDVSDAIHTLGFLFTGGAAPPCLDGADANDDGEVDLSDAVYTLLFLFGGGVPPPAPGSVTPGPDPSPDGLVCLEPGTAVVGEEGGAVEGPGGAMLEVPAGAFTEPTIVRVAVLPPEEVPALPPVNVPVLAVVVVGIGLEEEGSDGLRALPEKPLGLTVPVEGPDGDGVLAQAVVLEEAELFQEVVAVAVQGGQARTGEAFPGVLVSGLYAIFRVEPGVFHGRVEFADGESVVGAAVSRDADPNRIAITGGDGSYALVGTAAEAALVAATAGIPIHVSHPATCTQTGAVASAVIQLDCSNVACSRVGLRNGNFEDPVCLSSRYGPIPGSRTEDGKLLQKSPFFGPIRSMRLQVITREGESMLLDSKCASFRWGRVIAGSLMVVVLAAWPPAASGQGSCLLGNSNGDEQVDLSDSVYTWRAQFRFLERNERTET